MGRDDSIKLTYLLPIPFGLHELDSFAAKNAELKAYFEALKAALPKYKEYMSAAESFWK